MFDLKFQPPQNFASYRQAEIDNARVPTYTQMAAIPYMSNRFALKRFLGMSDEELAENERARQFTGNQDYIQNMYNAGSELANLGIDAGTNMNNAEVNAMINAGQFNTDLYNLANDSLASSYGYAGADNMRKDRMNEIDMCKMIFDQDAYNMRLMDFSDMIDKYAFGFPTKISTGTSSGKSSGFGFGIG
mgnify:CR=1 FL=1